MKFVLALAIAAVAIGSVAPSAAFAADVPTFVKKGVVYKTIRPKLLKKWKPFGKSIRVAGQCANGDLRCKWPETRDCAGTGLANCIMVFEHKKDHTIMEVYTAGAKKERVTGAKVAD